MFNISMANPFEVLLAICFVFIAVAVFIATFGVGLAYIFSNIKERWHEYTAQKKLKVISSLFIWAAIAATLITLSAIKLT